MVHSPAGSGPGIGPAAKPAGATGRADSAAASVASDGPAIPEPPGPSRRTRTRLARRDVFLAAARALIEEQGVGALTIKVLAERVDCAVGTLYTYFPSKGALMAAVQAQAIDRLRRASNRASDLLEEHLAHAGVEVDVAALARLVFFGRSVVAASVLFPEDFRLQQRLLHGEVHYDDADLSLVVPAAFAVLARPEQHLREAAVLGVLERGDALDRVVTWLAAVNGVLTLRTVQVAGQAELDADAMADRLHLDLLRGWGAPAVTLEHADRAAPATLVAQLLHDGGDR